MFPLPGYSESRVAALLAAILVGGGPAKAEGKRVDPKTVMRPAGTELQLPADTSALLPVGEKLFDSLKLSENGLTCKSCHFKLEAYEESFREPYPHAVGMAKKRAGLDSVHADEMNQLCLVVTMDSKPLPWGSEELRALTAYVLEQQQEFRNRSEK